MMILFRVVFGLLLLVSLGCFVMALVKRQPRWQRLGVSLLKWTLIAAAGFFFVLALERLLG
ncbi:ABC-type Na+ efflux pump permease subunit [Inhella inkyongensis]|uniref:ABC-type Na+ efflux pump permease subunit n=1 Tax=Inhella inkyongensis TaxID=392593 RepID=A0A840S305_9BURK|nr:hypothetical protein [Inhella inkyongensis]MBB5203456.1 ABC-type Na+ efflux pump permease subunit [Inhella inkyongensis]